VGHPEHRPRGNTRVSNFSIILAYHSRLHRQYWLQHVLMGPSRRNALFFTNAFHLIRNGHEVARSPLLNPSCKCFGSKRFNGPYPVSQVVSEISVLLISKLYHSANAVTCQELLLSWSGGTGMLSNQLYWTSPTDFIACSSLYTGKSSLGPDIPVYLHIFHLNSQA
jgi:hypothetical protein